MYEPASVPVTRTIGIDGSKRARNVTPIRISGAAGSGIATVNRPSSARVGGFGRSKIRPIESVINRPPQETCSSGPMTNRPRASGKISTSGAARPRDCCRRPTGRAGRRRGRPAPQPRAREVRAAIDRDDPADRRQREAEPELNAGKGNSATIRTASETGVRSRAGWRTASARTATKPRSISKAPTNGPVGAGRQHPRAARKRQHQLRGNARRRKWPDVLARNPNEAPRPIRNGNAAPTPSIPKARGRPGRPAAQPERQPIRSGASDGPSSSSSTPTLSIRSPWPAAGSAISPRVPPRVRAARRRRSARRSTAISACAVPPMRPATTAGSTSIELGRPERQRQCRRCARGDERHA